MLFGFLGLLLWLPNLDRYATVDEYRWLARSAEFGSYIGQGDLKETFITGHPGVTTMWLGSIGMGPEMVRILSVRHSREELTRGPGYLDALVAARRAVVLTNALALGGIVWLTAGLFGSGAALLGGLLILLEPFIGAHARVIHLDALLSSFMTLAVLSAITYWARGSGGHLVAAGLFTGLALMTKVAAIYLLAFIPLLALVERVRGNGWRAPGGWGRLVIALGAWAGIAGLVCLALWPALRVRPLVVPRETIEFAARNIGGERENFFLGQQLEDPGLLFYPIALLFRTTPLMLVGLALLGYCLIRRRHSLAHLRPALWLAAYVLGFVLMMSLGSKKFDRYILPIFPVLGLLAGLGLWQLVRSSRAPSARAAPAIAGLALVAAWPLTSVYPYYLSYYNPLLGGGSAAVRVLFVGWGEGLDRAAAYLNERPVVFQGLTVATTYPRVLETHSPAIRALPLERAEVADYVVPYVNTMQLEGKANVVAKYIGEAQSEHVVRMNGIEYAQVYPGPHLPRERSIASSFTNGAFLDSVVFAPGSGEARLEDYLLIRMRWRSVVDPASRVCTLRLVGRAGELVPGEPLSLAGGLQQSELLVQDVQFKLRDTIPPGEYELQAVLSDSTGMNLGPPALIYRLTIRPER